jgi:hypothetical protein
MNKATIVSLADKMWLSTVHLGFKEPWDFSHSFEFAIIHGNEDAPQKVELFKVNHYRCRPVVFLPDANGKLERDKKLSKNAGKLRPRTPAEVKAGCL